MIYLNILLMHYHNGAYIDTNLDLACQQAGMSRLELLGHLMDKGIKFKYKPVFFKKGENLIHAKSMDIIILSNGKN